MAKRTQKMSVVHPHAAGIDIGSRSHFVAVGQGKDQVKEFGVYTKNHQEMINWLKQEKIKTIAMESTGSYWQNLFSDLQNAGFEVYLVNGKFSKHMKGKKTDILDCQWIQNLHSLGLLSHSFLPDSTTEQLRTYLRHRSSLIESAALASKRMQKYLRLMNFRLDVVVKDICGLTGLKIIKAICQGESNTEKLAEFRHGNCHKSKQEIKEALQSNGRKDYLFALQQQHETYHETQEKIKKCDKQIQIFLDEYFDQNPEKKKLKTEDKIHKRKHKNTPKNIDINQVAFKFFGGVDLMNIEGIGHNTILTLMGEIGPDGLEKFDSAKQFTSWLRLAPNNKVSGGKIIKSKVQKGRNRLKTALRHAANTIGNLKNANLNPFFIRICIRKGRTAAITAKARKLAVIIWKMVVKKIPYNPPNQYEFLDQKRKRLVREMKKKMAKFDITTQELNQNNSLNFR